MPPINRPPKTVVIGGIGSTRRYNSLLVSAMLPALLTASRPAGTPVEEPTPKGEDPKPEYPHTEKRDGYTITRVDPSKFGGLMPAPGPAFKDDPKALQRSVDRLKSLVALNPGMRINPKRQAKKARKK